MLKVKIPFRAYLRQILCRDGYISAYMYYSKFWIICIFWFKKKITQI